MLMIERVRCLVPEPQVAEHAVNAVQLETRQSIGQANLLQVLYSLVRGQDTPPCTLAVSTERLRFLVPVPQVAVQALYLDQAETLQSTGQGKLLQVLYSLSIGQVTPL